MNFQGLFIINTYNLHWDNTFHLRAIFTMHTFSTTEEQPPLRYRVADSTKQCVHLWLRWSGGGRGEGLEKREMLVKDTKINTCSYGEPFQLLS